MRERGFARVGTGHSCCAVGMLPRERKTRHTAANFFRHTARRAAGLNIYYHVGHQGLGS